MEGSIYGLREMNEKFAKRYFKLNLRGLMNSLSGGFCRSKSRNITKR